MSLIKIYQRILLYLNQMLFLMHYMDNLVKMDTSNNFRTKKIPYTHSGVIASSIAMDKEISKKIFLKIKLILQNLLNILLIKMNYKINKNNK